MKIKEQKDKKDLTVKWDVIIPSNQIDTELDIKYNELQNQVNLPGFRPGKVPKNLIKKRYAKTVIPDVLDKVINETLTNAVKERKLKPSVQPKVEIKKYEEGKDLEFSANFQIMPEIPDFDLKSILVEKSKLNITKKDIDNSLSQIAEKHERFIPLKTKRKSKKGDLILFDYAGMIDRKPFEGSTGKDETVVLGSAKYIPGYEEQMEGMEIDEKKKIEVQFPDDYRLKKIASKKAVFDLYIKDIQERVENIPIDDKLAEEVGEKNLLQLRKKIEEKMKKDFETLSNLKMRREATEIMLKNFKFTIPSKMIEDEYNFLKNQSSEKDKKDKEIKDSANRRVKLGLIINSIAEKNTISVEDSDLTQAVVNEASKYPGQEKQVVDFYKNNPNLMNNLRGVALEEKIMKYVVNSCNKKDKVCTIDELFKSDFLRNEKKIISNKKKESEK
ncbi:MAG: trigger factor [Pseudomonadota bacterium]|nr:trigger factor [Pseudomonadota bacterium]